MFDKAIHQDLQEPASAVSFALELGVSCWIWAGRVFLDAGHVLDMPFLTHDLIPDQYFFHGFKLFHICRICSPPSVLPPKIFLQGLSRLPDPNFQASLRSTVAAALENSNGFQPLRQFYAHRVQVTYKRSPTVGELLCTKAFHFTPGSLMQSLLCFRSTQLGSTGGIVLAISDSWSSASSLTAAGSR